MSGYGGLVTFSVDGSRKETSTVVDRLTIPRIGPSLGGVESLVEQPMIMSYYSLTPEERQKVGIDDQMIRISLGIEDAKDQIADLKQALDIL